MRWLLRSVETLTINTEACERCIASIKRDPPPKKRKCVAGDERELMHIMSGWKCMRRITATLGDQDRGGESLRVSAFKYLNHAPVTPFPHEDISVYQNEGWQKTSVLVCVQTACVDSLMEPATLMHFLQSCKIPFKAVWNGRTFTCQEVIFAETAWVHCACSPNVQRFP